MEITQPGVTITENLISQKQDEAFVGIPVFIGYTQPAENNHASDKTAIKLNSLADFTLSFKQTGLMYYSVRHFFENDGQQAYVLSLGNYKDRKDFQSIITALQQDSVTKAISTESEITLIVVPDIAHFNDLRAQKDLWLQFWQSVLDLCKSRRGIMGLLDAPDDPTLAADCLAQFSSNDRQWGAVYWPMVKSAYQEKNQPIVLSPTAAVAAIIQRNDNQQGVWTAPANVALAKVISPVRSYIEANALFNPDGASLNLIRSFPGKGIRVWGCRTLENTNNTPWRYLQTRRLVSYVTVHLAQLARMYIFEPNNELTWMKCKGQSYNWLRQLWLQGGLYGSREDEAFTVLLGVNETMTEEDIRAGKMVMKVALAVLSPAEFIEISLVFDTQTGALLS
ncbi:phage tail sheath family protein [Photorhabdus kleinii]|uniref:phage tail sheath family protein n=1 Tax=Photorhabdus kleinii TaxID=768034 RepID=UPI0021D4D2EC|nr:phage tail sheath C-terminal domain-containing protein [Photorhabdus kleinii]MCT8343436.1 phage tail sheath family protein [Photorhabdus kleinii]